MRQEAVRGGQKVRLHGISAIIIFFNTVQLAVDLVNMRQEADKRCVYVVFAQICIFLSLDTAGSRPGEHEAGGGQKVHLRGIRANMYFSLFGYSWQ
jgi:hypothetical protein